MKNLEWGRSANCLARTLPPCASQQVCNRQTQTRAFALLPRKVAAKEFEYPLLEVRRNTRSCVSDSRKGYAIALVTNQNRNLSVFSAELIALRNQIDRRLQKFILSQNNLSSPSGSSISTFLSFAVSSQRSAASLMTDCGEASSIISSICWLSASENPEGHLPALSVFRHCAPTSQFSCVRPPAIRPSASF